MTDISDQLVNQNYSNVIANNYFYVWHSYTPDTVNLLYFWTKDRPGEPDKVKNAILQVWYIGLKGTVPAIGGWGGKGGDWGMIVEEKGQEAGGLTTHKHSPVK